jgi:hypothetical protein
LLVSVRTLCSYVYDSAPSNQTQTTLEDTKVNECSAPILYSKERTLPSTSEPLNNRSFQQCNELSAAFATFISQLLIERSFFQNSGVSPSALLYLANDLIQTLAPQHRETLSVTKELQITWKQIRGEPLTAEEQNIKSNTRNNTYVRVHEGCSLL